MWDFTSSDHFPCFLYILYVHIALILWLRDLKFKTSNTKTPTAGYDKTAPPISYLHNIWGEDSLLEGITLVFSLWQQMAALPTKQSPVPNWQDAEWASALVSMRCWKRKLCLRQESNSILRHPARSLVSVHWAIWYIFSHRTFFNGPGSVDGIANGYGLGGPGIESRGGEIFRTCPDRPWAPPSLLYNGYRVFHGGKERAGRNADPSPF